MKEYELNEKPQKRRSYWKICLVGGCVIFLSIWFLSPSGAINKPVRLERGEDGQLHAVGDDARDHNFVVSANAAIVKSSSSKSSATSSSNSDPGWFKARKLIVMNRSDHLLMDRVGEALLDELNKRPTWDDVVYLPHGFDMSKELVASDIYMTINLVSIKDTGTGIVGRNLDADITCLIGTSLIASNNSVHDSLSPPTFAFRSHVSLEHQSTLTGIESAGAKYSLQAQKIAEDLVASLHDQLDGFQEDHEPAPLEVNKLQAEYLPTPKFGFLKEAKLLASTHGIMVHNETLWEIENVDDSTELIEDVSQRLQLDGWKEYTKQLNENSQYLRLQNDSKWIEVFSEKNSFQATLNKDYPEQWYVRYCHRMNHAELGEIYDSFLNSDPPDVELLLALDRMANRGQRDQLLKITEEHSPTSARGWLRLATWYGVQKNQEQLIYSLKRANVASLFVQDRSEMSRKIKEIIKKYKLNAEDVSTIDVTMLEDAGIQSITSETPKAKEEFKVSEHVAFYIPGDIPAEWSYVSAVIEESEQGRFRVSFYHGDHMGSHGRSSVCCIDLAHGKKHRIHLDDHEIEMDIHKTEDQHFEVSIVLKGDD